MGVFIFLAVTCSLAASLGLKLWRKKPEFDIIPTISLEEDCEETIARKIREACVTWGFFYLKNSDVSDGLMNSTFTAAKELFQLPTQVKLTLSNDINRGYTGRGRECLDPEHQTEGDTKEGFYIGREVHSNSLESKLPLHGPNVWPSDHLPSWRGTMEKYFSAMLGLGTKLRPLFALALHSPRDTFDKLGMFDKPMATLRLLHYYPQASAPSLGVLAAGAHTDYGFCTILATDDVPGLEVYDREREQWIPIPPKKNHFVVNIGDMMERWSNGVFSSTIHRVVNYSGSERYSIAFFYEPNYDCLVECLPPCCDPLYPARYPPVRSGDHLQRKYAKTYQN